MANDIIPQDLIIYKRILSDALVKITNEMYANNIKVSYKCDFTLVPQQQKPTPFINSASPLYLFRVFAVDKSRNPIGETHYLYNNYYPKTIETSLHALERIAIQDWFTNASKALYNFMHEQYMEDQRERQAILDERKAKGLTIDVIKAEVAAKEKQTFQEREQEIMKMMHPNVK